MAHPWELTLRQFVDRTWRDYGVKLVILPLPEAGSILVLGGLIYPLPAIGEDDLLSPEVQERICALFGLPRSDFHLDSGPEDG